MGSDFICYAIAHILKCQKTVGSPTTRSELRIRYHCIQPVLLEGIGQLYLLTAVCKRHALASGIIGDSDRAACEQFPVRGISRDNAGYRLLRDIAATVVSNDVQIVVFFRSAVCATDFQADTAQIIGSWHVFLLSVGRTREVNLASYKTNTVTYGVAAIGVGVIVTAATGGAGVPVLVASIKMAATSAVIGAVSGAGAGAIKHRVSTGSWRGAEKAAVHGAINGACDGFMWGGITAGATFTAAAAKGVKIRQIGKLKPDNKSGEGFPGVKYQVRKTNGKLTTRSLELHSPHGGGPHKYWHWQKNTWSEYDGVSRITGSSRHWRLWGKRF